MSCKVITYGSHLSGFLLSKVSHFVSLPVSMHKFHDHLEVNTSRKLRLVVCAQNIEQY